MVSAGPSSLTPAMCYMLLLQGHPDVSPGLPQGPSLPVLPPPEQPGSLVSAGQVPSGVCRRSSAELEGGKFLGVGKCWGWTRGQRSWVDRTEAVGGETGRGGGNLLVWPGWPVMVIPSLEKDHVLGHQAWLPQTPGNALVPPPALLCELGCIYSIH